MREKTMVRVIGINDTGTTEIYTYRHTLAQHDARPITASAAGLASRARGLQDRRPGHQQSDPWRAGRVRGGDGAQRSGLAAGAGGYRDAHRPAIDVARAARPTGCALDRTSVG